jgi:hypothetical protein
VRLSEATADRALVPPDATVLGLGVPAETENEWATGWTVSEVESLSPKGEGPLHVAFTVNVTIRFESPVLAGAV